MAILVLLSQLGRNTAIGFRQYLTSDSSGLFCTATD